jgi:hypothetical protein
MTCSESSIPGLLAVVVDGNALTCRVQAQTATKGLLSRAGANWRMKVPGWLLGQVVPNAATSSGRRPNAPHIDCSCALQQPRTTANGLSLCSGIDN